VTFCCFNAGLRDYARFGRLLAHDGAWNGRQLVSRQWLIDATTLRPSDAHLAPGKADALHGYGYQVWLRPGPARRFTLIGVRGQMIFVDPATRLVMDRRASEVCRSGAPRDRCAMDRGGEPIRRQWTIGRASHSSLGN
jgi:CubicO group peptidase (beta-lactamase class C family)